MTARVAPSWRPRATPLRPVALLAHGEAAPALLARLRALDDAALARLRGVAGDGVVVVCGEADELPWVDGGLYLGVDPAAPSLRVPTALAPSVPFDLLEQALLARERAAPLAVVPGLVVSLAEALPVSREKLA